MAMNVQQPPHDALLLDAGVFQEGKWFASRMSLGIGMEIIIISH